MGTFLPVIIHADVFSSLLHEYLVIYLELINIMGFLLLHLAKNLSQVKGDL